MRKWQKFEEEKRKLAEKALSDREHQKAVKKLAKKFGL